MLRVFECSSIQLWCTQYNVKDVILEAGRLCIDREDVESRGSCWAVHSPVHRVVRVLRSQAASMLVAVEAEPRHMP